MTGSAGRADRFAAWEKKTRGGAGGEGARARSDGDPGEFLLGAPEGSKNGLLFSVIFCRFSGPFWGPKSNTKMVRTIFKKQRKNQRFFNISWVSRGLKINIKTHPKFGQFFYGF